MLCLLTELLNEGKDLTTAQAMIAFDELLSGVSNEMEAIPFLQALSKKGENAEEILAAARCMRGKMLPFEAPEEAMDLCGTGGDNKSSYNISTAAAFVVAACGVPVIKHGNRSVSSTTGSSDVLSALGLPVDASNDTLQRCLENTNLCFLFAPRYHPALRHVASMRQQIGTRTIFNILGPLCNPASVKRQLLGVYDGDLVDPLAWVLHALGTEFAWVVHGTDGMDEISPCAETEVVEVNCGAFESFNVSAEAAGIPVANPDDLRGGNAADNAVALRNVLAGESSAYADAVRLNTAASLIVAGRASDMQSGLALASEAITSGRALNTLNSLIEISNAHG